MQIKNVVYVLYTSINSLHVFILLKAGLISKKEQTNLLV